MENDIHYRSLNWDETKRVSLELKQRIEESCTEISNAFKSLYAKVNQESN